MAETMTRAQAICACRNIRNLAEANKRVPETMAVGIIERTESMEDSITENSQYTSITERMDSALHNMWAGLRKWDRDNKYADDLFEDLESVEGEIADLDASGGNKPPPKGRESEDDEAAKKRAAALAKTAPTAASPTTAALRGKEKCVGEVLSQIASAGITVIDKEKIRHHSIGDILGMTKSDRTQQLIKAAYFVGVLRGVSALYGQLTEDGRKT